MASLLIKLYQGIAGATILGVAGGNGYYLYAQQKQLQKNDKLPYCVLGSTAILFKSVGYGYLWPYTAYKLAMDPTPVVHPLYSVELDITFDRQRFQKKKKSDVITYSP